MSHYHRYVVSVERQQPITRPEVSLELRRLSLHGYRIRDDSAPTVLVLVPGTNTELTMDVDHLWSRSRSPDLRRLLSVNLSRLRICPACHSDIISQILYILEVESRDAVLPGCIHIIEEVVWQLRAETGLEAALRESEAEAERHPDGMIPASEEAITALGTAAVERGGEKCMVCLEELSEGSVVTCMPCDHVFHGDCITQWLRKSHFCPNCRFELPAAATY